MNLHWQLLWDNPPKQRIFPKIYAGMLDVRKLNQYCHHPFTFTAKGRDHEMTHQLFLSYAIVVHSTSLVGPICDIITPSPPLLLVPYLSKMCVQRFCTLIMWPNIPQFSLCDKIYKFSVSTNLVQHIHCFCDPSSWFTVHTAPTEILEKLVNASMYHSKMKRDDNFLTTVPYITKQHQHTSFEPANSGSPVCISTSMQPRLHISMARSYGRPSRTSGDR